MQPMLNIAIGAARKAGKLAVRALDHLDSISVAEKGRNNFVTEIDKLVENDLIESLSKAYPDHSFLGEEGGLKKRDPDQVWVIDPIDGTTNFIHGFPHFCISIAFTYKGRLQHGLIYDPVRQELFTASRGEGAQLNDKRIRVSPEKHMEYAMVATGFPIRKSQSLKLHLKSIEAVTPLVSAVRRTGSAALDLAYVAAGRFDGFWEVGLKEWDMAAGVLLVKEAGGLISDIHGGEHTVETGSIVAGTPKVFKGLLQTLRPIFEEKTKEKTENEK